MRADHHHDHSDEDEVHEPSDRARHGTDHGALQGAMLLALGAYLAYLVASGDVGNYVNLRFAWVALAGAVLSVLLGACALLGSLRAGRGSVLADAHGGHAHATAPRTNLLFVAVPLALGLLVPSQPLGAGAVGKDLTFGNISPQGATIVSADTLQWSVMDWLRASSYGTSPERLTGKPADVLGFVYRRDGDPPGVFILSRFLMVHCTADAYAVGIPVLWDRADGLAVDTWVRVHGTVQVGPFAGNTLPIVRAEVVDERVGRPSQVYLYQ